MVGAPASRPVVLVGPREDAELLRVGQLLAARGVASLAADPLTSFAGAACAVEPGAKAEGGAAGELAGLPGRPRAVYVRSLANSPLMAPEAWDGAMQDGWYATLNAFRERQAFWLSALALWEAKGARLVNPPGAAGGGQKPWMLARMAAAGCDVPRTLFSGDPARVREFASRVGRVVYKPLTGSAHARLLAPEDLTDERLAALESAPVCFQEYVPGRNIRVYVVGERVVGAVEIQASAEVDYRGAETGVARVELPAPVAAACLAAARACGLAFSGIDLRRDGERWALLECNTSPMFVALERWSSLPVGEALSDYLAGA